MEINLNEHKYNAIIDTIAGMPHGREFLSILAIVTKQQEQLVKRIKELETLCELAHEMNTDLLNKIEETGKLTGLITTTDDDL